MITKTLLAFSISFLTIGSCNWLVSDIEPNAHSQNIEIPNQTPSKLNCCPPPEQIKALLAQREAHIDSLIFKAEKKIDSLKKTKRPSNRANQR